MDIDEKARTFLEKIPSLTRYTPSTGEAHRISDGKCINIADKKAKENIDKLFEGSSSGYNSFYLVGDINDNESDLDNIVYLDTYNMLELAQMEDSPFTVVEKLRKPLLAQDKPYTEVTFRITLGPIHVAEVQGECELSHTENKKRENLLNAIKEFDDLIELLEENMLSVTNVDKWALAELKTSYPDSFKAHYIRLVDNSSAGNLNQSTIMTRENVNEVIETAKTARTKFVKECTELAKFAETHGTGHVIVKDDIVEICGNVFYLNELAADDALKKRLQNDINVQKSYAALKAHNDDCLIWEADAVEIPENLDNPEQWFIKEILGNHQISLADFERISELIEERKQIILSD